MNEEISSKRIRRKENEDSNESIDKFDLNGFHPDTMNISSNDYTSPDSLKVYFDKLVNLHKKTEKNLKNISSKFGAKNQDLKQKSKHNETYMKTQSKMQNIEERLRNFIKKYHKYIKTRKNSYGSFSTDLYMTDIKNMDKNNPIINHVFPNTSGDFQMNNHVQTMEFDSRKDKKNGKQSKPGRKPSLKDFSSKDEMKFDGVYTQILKPNVPSPMSKKRQISNSSSFEQVFESDGLAIRPSQPPPFQSQPPIKNTPFVTLNKYETNNHQKESIRGEKIMNNANQQNNNEKQNTNTKNSVDHNKTPYYQNVHNFDQRQAFARNFVNTNPQNPQFYPNYPNFPMPMPYSGGRSHQEAQYGFKPNFMPDARNNMSQNNPHFQNEMIRKGMFEQQPAVNPNMQPRMAGVNPNLLFEDKTNIHNPEYNYPEFEKKGINSVLSKQREVAQQNVINRSNEREDLPPGSKLIKNNSMQSSSTSLNPLENTLKGKVISDKRIDELLGDVKISDEAKLFLLEMCDLFIESVCDTSCKISKLRNSKFLDIEDMKMALKCEFDFESPDDKNYIKSVQNDQEHEKKLQIISKENSKRNRM